MYRSASLIFVLLAGLIFSPVATAQKKPTLKERLEKAAEGIRIGTRTGDSGTINPGSSTARPGNCTQNTTFVCARKADLNGTYEARIVDGARKHYYQFDTDRAGTIQVLIDPVPLDIGIGVEMFDAEQTRYGQAQTAAGKALHYYEALARGTSYLVVEGMYPYQSRDPYTIRFKFVPDETESQVTESRCAGLNNRLVCAKTIPLDGNASGYLLHGSRKHFYKLTSTIPGTVDLKIDPVPTDIGLRLVTYTAEQEELSGEQTNAGQNMFYTFAVPPGEMYFSIEGGYPYFSLEPYSVSLTFSGVEPYEPNETFVQAGRIPRNEPVMAWLSTGTDLDYYAVDLRQAGPVTITVDPVPAEVQLYLNVFTPRQEPLGRGAAARAAGMRLEYSFDAPTAGTYYFLVGDSQRSGSRDAYTLIVK